MALITISILVILITLKNNIRSNKLNEININDKNNNT